MRRANLDELIANSAGRTSGYAAVRLRGLRASYRRRFVAVCRLAARPPRLINRCLPLRATICSAVRAASQTRFISAARANN